MHTEAEAKELWCPFARSAFQYRTGSVNGDCMIVANRSENDQPISSCIASKCAAWRWAKDGGPMFAKPDGTIWYSHGHAEWIKTAEEAGYIRMEQKGFCGLAGAPR